MQQPDKIKQYLETVEKQVRWKKARPVIIEELENHILDQKYAFMNKGYDEETSIDKSIAEMGNPVAVGEQLDRTHRPEPDWRLIAITGVIMIAGLLLQLVIQTGQGNDGLFERQLVWAGISVIVMAGAYFIDFTAIGRFPILIFFSLGLLTIISFFTGTVNGAHRFAIYPLLLYPAAYAGLIHSMRDRGYAGLLLSGTAIILPAFLALFVPSVTMLTLICLSCLILLTGAVLSGAFNIRKIPGLMIILFSVILGFLIIWIIIMNRENYVHRLLVFLDPSRDPSGAGYMGTLVQNLLSHSRFIGQGYAITGMQYSFSLLPEVNTNFVLVYLVYRFGWISLIGIASLFAAFIIRSAGLSAKQQSNLGALVSRAVILTISIELLFYITTNLGFMMFSPLSLPLISFGGAAMVVNMFLVGLLLSVFRTGAYARDKAKRPDASRQGFIHYENGEIIIKLRNRSAR